ncbi:MAG: nuclease A inhibitor family protein [Cyanobacteria bacterium J06621_11]
MTSKSQLKSQLEAACYDLWWRSESDYPIEVVWHPAMPNQDLAESDLAKPETPTLLHQIMDIEDDKALAVVDIEDFFAKQLTPKSWHTAEDKAQLNQLQQLKILLSESLEQIQVYRYGTVEVLIYVLGYTLEKDIAGVKTCSVET